MRQHPKILDHKKRATPIVYSNVVIDERGQLKDRKSLLDERIVAGYGVIWGSKNSHEEKVARGAYAKSIADNGPKSNSNYKIKFRDRHGKAVSLFAELTEDEIGLYFRTVPLDNVPWADNLLEQLKTGTINNFSVGFMFNWDRVEWDEKDDCLIILEAYLLEISAVDIPSDKETHVLRSSQDFQTLTDDVENFIRRSIPKALQLDARKIFTRCMSLTNDEPHEAKRNALKNKKPAKAGLDYDYLLSKL